MSYLFTSESVAAGHPDKVCDQISDTLLDELLQHDPESRVAIETVASGSQIHVVGEMRSTHELSPVRVQELVRQKLAAIGYTPASYGLDFNDAASVSINVAISQQSPDIAQGVDNSLEVRSGQAADAYDRLGAGDQGIIFGYASNELAGAPAHRDSFMPAAIHLAHQLSRGYSDLQKQRQQDLGPDAKTQVTLRYARPGQPLEVDTVLISAQHAEHLHSEELAALLHSEVINPTLASSGLDASQTRLIINPSGRFIIGGPVGDAGLTGRKIVVDTYGGYAPHGGGAFSGKDPSKVDRSAAYAARWVAKNLVANGLAQHATVQIAYAIGAAHPVSVCVLSDNPQQDEKLEKVVRERFDLRPAAIIDRLQLQRFNAYQQTAAFGHFGRTDISLPWEQVITL